MYTQSKPCDSMIFAESASVAPSAARVLPPARSAFSRLRGESATVPQAGGDAVDGEVDRAQQALVAAVGAVAAQELDLQVVPRVEGRGAGAGRGGGGRPFR